MKNAYLAIIGASALAVLIGLGAVFLSGWDRPPLEAEQLGYRGLAMEAVTNPRVPGAAEALASVPEPPFDLEEDSDSPRASEVYENVPLLGDMSQEAFDRLMAAITEWVAPEEESCAYCHDLEDLASDEVYAKDVSRRMIEMTRHINSNWDQHVGATGVTCYTCHRGNPVPSEIWFGAFGPPEAGGMAGGRAGQNIAAAHIGLTSLPNDPFTQLVKGDGEVRVIAGTALPAGEGQTIMQTEVTYGLMMHLSQALGVNCTFCHNSRSFFAWDQSPPQRTTAWHGIRMMRDLNVEYLEPLASLYPPERLGPHDEAPLANCATCHQGLSKPLGGAAMVVDYPSLSGPTQQAAEPQQSAEAQ